MPASLKTYREKRNFSVTSEPAGGGRANTREPAFVIQKHWATRLHYDLRLELDGAMKSWAVPKGPSYDPTIKRMAVQVEDHPIAYNQFEGEIPKGQYGAGKVIIWDEGTWQPVGDPRKGYREGHLKFTLRGVKMQGQWALVRLKRGDEKQPTWLLIKDRDELARPDAEFSVVDEMPDSVVPLRGKRRAASTRSRQTEQAPAVEAAMPGVASDMPRTLKPQLATLVDRAPASAADWLYEIKYDGYRILARIENGQARLYTRNGHDWTDRMPHLAEALARAKADAWVDGEIVVLTDQGTPSFQALQNAFDNGRTAGIQFFAFDLPYVAGRDLRGEPLTVRRALLEQLVAPIRRKAVQLSATLDAGPSELVRTACGMGLEGIIGKRRDSTYVSRRSDNWIKLKCGQRQEFVIVGYTDPGGRRVGFGSLLLAVHDDEGGLRYAGNVGTGFDDDMLRRLKQQLDALRTDRSALRSRAGVEGRPHWVRPELVAEVSFGEWTQGGHVRHPVFRGLRGDKPAGAIVRERPQAPPKETPRATGSKPATTRPASKSSSGKTASGRLSSPERVIDPSTGLTKLDLARYYGLVAPLMVPHLKGRPVAFLRAPQGIHHQLFFQKHQDGTIPDVRNLPEKLYPDHPPMMEVATDMGILSAAQMNVVEFHTWNAVKTSIARPDRMLFDLDPGDGVAWPAIREGAQLVQALLRELDLACWLKTSGGKGLHVVVPLRKQYDWDAVRQFSEVIVRHLARTLPQRFVAKSGPKNRVGKIFVDYLRNGFGATTVAAWSARARSGMGISVPIAWDELPRLSGAAQWTIANAHDRLDVGNAPWDDYTPQSLGKAMAILEFR
ncbi:DNA ligase D [Bordetella genomosp. 13]|uniref:DNA ligase (ATP) n=1 Tax=Bordetella genomosp. 13 TaxID=463040 RepID=A0A1W6ZCK3_9BORD|nr:DNA ligase D [Bordetella genomosp. 13]ARP95027.1 DNA ligase D [Bordetella genomosp. 13]